MISLFKDVFNSASDTEDPKTKMRSLMIKTAIRKRD